MTSHLAQNMTKHLAKHICYFLQKSETLDQAAMPAREDFFGDLEDLEEKQEEEEEAAEQEEEEQEEQQEAAEQEAPQ
jgi:hypothetical protein